ncbi:MAG: type IV secretion protein Rhs [Alistipes sp.]|nr:type IV secretion protein Rhs [Alistipes sp.]
MNRFKFLLTLAFAVISCVSFVSCSDDDDDNLNQDMASQVAGVYTGKLTVNDEVIEDAYVVTVTRISSSVVSVSAKFLNESENYNIVYENGQYKFKSATINNINIVVTGKNINVSYLTNGGWMANFFGTRD